MYPWQSGSNGREETQIVHLNPRSGHWHPDKSHLPAPRQRRDRLQRLAVLRRRPTTSSSWRSTAPRCCSRSPASGRASPTYDQALRPLRDPGCHGPGRVPRRLSRTPTSRGCDNNAYTNVMVVWLLQRAQDALEVAARAGVARAAREARHRGARSWSGGRSISRRMVVPFHDGDIISQFEGYEQLEEFDWEGYTRAVRRTSSGSTASSRPRATRPTATRSPSRPTC